MSCRVTEERTGSSDMWGWWWGVQGGATFAERPSPPRPLWIRCQANLLKNILISEIVVVYIVIETLLGGLVPCNVFLPRFLGWVGSSVWRFLSSLSLFVAGLVESLESGPHQCSSACPTTPEVRVYLRCVFAVKGNGGYIDWSDYTYHRSEQKIAA